MRCFSVDEGEVVGMDLVEKEGRLFLEVGNTLLGLDSALERRLLDAKKNAIEVLEGCVASRSYQGRTITEEDLAELEDILEDTRRGTIRLLLADLEEERNIVSEKNWHLDALVLVKTLAGIRGRIRYMCTTQEEFISETSRRVKKRFREEFPPPGVSVVAEGKLGRSSRSYLLRMMPNSSFRIQRSGLLDGAPRVLTVAWKGKVGPSGESPLWVYPGR